MTGFEVFNKNRTLHRARMGWTLTITNRGQINISGEIHEKLGYPEYAEYLYDADRKIFAIRPAEDRFNAYKFRKPQETGYTGVFAQQALDAYGIDYTKTRRYTPWIENGLLCIDASDTPAPTKEPQ